MRKIIKIVYGITSVSLFSCVPAAENATTKPSKNPCDQAVPSDPTCVATGAPLQIPAPLTNRENLSASAAQEIDTKNPQYRELSKFRNFEGASVDHCASDPAPSNTFADKISFEINEAMAPHVAQLDYIADIYGLPTKIIPNHLMSHRLCEVSQSTLQETIAGRAMPSAATIKKANDFSTKMNQYRQEAIQGNLDSLLAAHKLWNRFMMCLAYTESLTTADSSSSNSIANSMGVRKPAGVEYYLDGNQPAASKLNIGLYQFSPTSDGNIVACLREWNKQRPACPISTSTTTTQWIDILGSSQQSFNAFCGVTKITDLFAVQANTVKPTNTHPANRISSTELRPQDQRCVTPFFATKFSYNHFGPLQNTTGSNLEELLTCTLN